MYSEDEFEDVDSTVEPKGISTVTRQRHKTLGAVAVKHVDINQRKGLTEDNDIGKQTESEVRLHMEKVLLKM